VAAPVTCSEQPSSEPAWSSTHTSCGRAGFGLSKSIVSDPALAERESVV
jgi:hypothetical protein